MLLLLLLEHWATQPHPTVRLPDYTICHSQTTSSTH